MQTATVAIGTRTWTVQVAETAAERTQGLSGTPSLAANTGMLFDLGSPQSSVVLVMSGMLYPLWVMWITEDYRVISIGGVVAGAADQTINFNVGDYPRYFLEVNASESSGVAIGDIAAITGYTPSTSLDIGSLMSMMVTMMIVVMMMKMMMNSMKELE